MISVENASHELINNTLNFNRLFKMDYDKKYIKYDSIKYIKDSDKLNLRK